MDCSLKISRHTLHILTRYHGRRIVCLSWVKHCFQSIQDYLIVFSADYTPANISVSYEPSNSQIVAKCNATCTGAVVVLQEVDDNDIILFNDSIVSSLSNQQAIFTGIEEGNEYCISIYFLHNGSMIGATRESSTVDTKVPSKTEPIKLEIVVPITIIITIIIITLSIALSKFDRYSMVSIIYYLYHSQLSFYARRKSTEYIILTKKVVMLHQALVKLCLL